MTTVRSLRSLAAAVLATALLAAAFTVAPAAPSAAANGSPGSLDGTGLPPTGSDFRDPDTSPDPGPSGTVTCVQPVTGAALLSGVPAYAFHPYCQPDNEYPTSGVVTHVKTCMTKLAVWRFYGTETDPAKATTYSELPAPDLCLPPSKFRWRMYPASPMDVAGVSIPSSREYVWNIQNNVRPILNEAYNKEQMNGSDSCFRYNNSDVDLTGISCEVTTGKPVSWAGQSCKSVQPPAAESLAGWLASTDPVKKSLAQQRLYNNYRELAAANRPPVAAQLANIANSSARTSPTITGPTSITALDTLDCSSVVDFVKMPVVAGDPNQRRLSVCFAGIMENGFSAAKGPRPLLYEYSWHPGQLRPMYNPAAPQVSGAGVSVFNGTMIKMSALRKLGTPGVQTASQTARLRNELLGGIRETLENYSKTSPEFNRPAGYYQPEASRMSWESLKPTDPSVLTVNGAMTTLSDPSWEALTCYSSRVSDAITPTPLPPRTPTPPPTETPTPPRIPTPDPPRPNVPGPGGGGDTFVGTPTLSGPVRVTIDMPRNLAVRGLYGPYPQVRVTDVALMCGGRECNHWANELEPVLLGASGTLAVRANGNYGVECTRLAAILDNGASSGCGYATDTPQFGALSGQSLRMAFFSATPTSVRIAPLISGGSASVQYYRLETRIRNVDDGPCDATYGPYNPVTQTRPLMQPSPDCRKTREEQYTVVVPDGGPRTVGLSIAAADGRPLERQVFGSVGGSGG